MCVHVRPSGLLKLTRESDWEVYEEVSVQCLTELLLLQSEDCRESQGVGNESVCSKHAVQLGLNLVK